MLFSSHVRLAYLLTNEIEPSYSSYRRRPSARPKPNTLSSLFSVLKPAQIELEDRIREYLNSEYARGKTSGEKQGEGDDSEPEPRKLQKQFTSLFEESEKYFPPLYGSMVDYSIGRKFAITESGWMGLVPKKTKKGDVVTLLGRERWCFVLRPDGGKGEKDRETERDEESEKGPRKMMRTPASVLSLWVKRIFTAWSLMEMKIWQMMGIRKGVRVIRKTRWEQE